MRINLNNNFHKNADKSIVRGNRINVFSTKEYIDKGDDKTYYKCFKLPYESIQNTDDFIDMLDYLWEYINVKNKNVFSINIQKSIL